ncbi:diguanylate cyclase [Acetobacterium sp.]|uniref:sensor domain-containing diguanylate cyclase n=1 Tax=Acetobacterium sp. TaxID=1872094 RepID=UPI003593972F
MSEQLLENLQIVTYRCSGDEQRRVLEISENIKALTGYQDPYFTSGIPTDLDRIVHPDDQGKIRQAIIAHLHEASPFTLEYRIIGADDGVRWVLDQGRSNADGSEIAGILIDVTAKNEQDLRQKAWQAACRVEADQFEAILDHMPGMIYYKDRENRFIRVNKMMAEENGLPKEALEGKNLSAIYPLELAERYYQDDLAVINSGEPRLNIVEKFTTRKGLRWVNTSKLPFRDEAGAIIGVIGMSFDITERIEAEKKVKVLQTAIEQSPIMVLITDPDGTITYVNNTFMAVTGYSREEALGQNPRMLKLNRDVKIDYQNLWETILAGEDWQGIFQNRKKNGQPYWEQAIIAPIFDDDGQLYKFIGIKQDITEEYHNRQALEKLYQEDMLTQVFNRRSFFEQLERNAIRYQTEAVEWAMLMLDIDLFKQINDTYGHAVGDQALWGFAEICKKNVRKTDLIGRIGGEEFAICLEHTGFEEALQMARRLCKNVAASELVLDNGTVIKYTVSIGLSLPRTADETFEEVLKRADTAMYSAKNNGRNRVELSL